MARIWEEMFQYYTLGYSQFNSSSIYCILYTVRWVTAIGLHRDCQGAVGQQEVAPTITWGVREGKGIAKG